MNRLAVPGGWYADVAGTAGDYAVLVVDSHIQTSRGRVELPGENALYLRATLMGGFALCGVGGGSDRALMWTGTVWDNRGPAHGVSACIFDNNGALRIATPAQGSQGYRYCATDGSLVTGDDTYNSITPFAVAHGVFNLWEWTQYGDITIGQNSKDECVIVNPTGRRVLEFGQCRFIRFVRDGSKLAVAMWKPLENCSVLHWLTTAEIALLPLESSTTPPVDPPIPPIDPPDPEIPVRLPDDVYATLVALRPKYPTPLVDKGAELLNEVAWTHRAQGYGLEQKDGGANCGCPGITVRMGCDILRTLTLGWDCLQDAEGTGNPVQSDSGPADPARFVAPVKPAGTVPPVEPPVEPPTDPALEQRVTTLEAKVAAQQVQLTEQKELLAAQEIALSELDQRVFDLEAEDPTEPPEAAPDSLPVTLRAFGENYSGILDKEE